MVSAEIIVLQSDAVFKATLQRGRALVSAEMATVSSARVMATGFNGAALW